MTFIGANRDAWGYLLDTVATEHTIDRASDKASYYMAGGTPAGIWAGTGAAHLTLGDKVEEEHLVALFGAGTHPITGAKLGRAFNTAVSLDDRVRMRIAAAVQNPELAGVDLETLHDEIYQEELERPQKQSVAGFEFVFSPPKSVSSWWALADPTLKDEIRQAHHAAIQATIAKLEQDYIRTRTGTDGVAQQHVRGITAALFDHWDSREGDPQLHTHMLVSNRVQGEDGRWRTIDSRWSLSPAVATAGVYYDTVLMDELSNRFGVRWTTQDVLEQPEAFQEWLVDRQLPDTPAARHQFAIAQGTRPASIRWQIEHVPAALNDAFSTRARAINCEKDALIAEYVRKNGKEPSARTVIRIRQRATLTTRRAKRVQTLKELTASWRERARAHVGDSFLFADRVKQRGSQQLAELPLWTFRHDDVDDDAAAAAAAFALHNLAVARSTWSKRNAEAEVMRAIAGWRFRSTTDRDLACTRITSLVLDEAIKLTPASPLRIPHRFRTREGENMFHPEARDLYTTREVWEAEERLLTAGRRTDSLRVDPEVVEALIHTPAGVKQRELSADKIVAVRNLVTSGRAVDVLVGPAGAGKTTSLEKLREIWEAQYGPGSVRGLAPTARAARVLADSLGIETENTAKWLYESAHTAPDEERFDFQLRPGDLMIVDEASIAGTIALDQLRAEAEAAGAKLLLVGDWAQLAAIDAGGAFGLLATDRDDVPELHQLHRFAEDWEAQASLLLRLGKTAGLDPYIEHGRVEWGLDETVVAAAVDAWKRDEATLADDGTRHLTSLLIAPTNDMVERLNDLARTWLIEQGVVDDTVQGHVASGVASPGDRIVTRKNARRIRTDHGNWVQNNDEWVVVSIDDTGDIVAAAGEEIVRLPADYCAEHVQLGYATTAHRAQGRTVDTAHTIIDASIARELFYVSMSRGELSNRAYVVVDQDAELGDPAAARMTRTWREILEHVVTRRGGDLSAHETITAEAERIGSIRQLAAERQTLISDQLERDYLPVLEAFGLVDREQADSPYLGPVVANLRRLEVAGQPLHETVGKLLARRELDDASDVLAVLHYRLAAHLGEQELPYGARVAGLLEPAPTIKDPDVAAAIADRDLAIQLRAELLVDQALANGEPWIEDIGQPVLGAEEAWRQRAVTVACYRDLYGVDAADALGREHEQAVSRQCDRAIAAAALAPRPAPAEDRFTVQTTAPQTTAERGPTLG